MNFLNALNKSKYFILIYCFHLMFSHFILPVLGKFDFYPFFQWNLYSFLPDQQTFYFLRILEINNQTLEKPEVINFDRVKYKGLKPFLVPYQLISLGQCLEKSGCVDLDVLKQQIEKNLFASYQQVQYQILSKKMSSRSVIYLADDFEMKMVKEFIYLNPIGRK